MVLSSDALRQMPVLAFPPLLEIMFDEIELPLEESRKMPSLLPLARLSEMMLLLQEGKRRIPTQVLLLAVLPEMVLLREESSQMPRLFPLAVLSVMLLLLQAGSRRIPDSELLLAVLPEMVLLLLE
jgi:hypothetical protein